LIEFFAFEGTMPMDCLFVIEKKEKLAGKHRKQKNSLLTQAKTGRWLKLGF
jgi:hypothetical protein